MNQKAGYIKNIDVLSYYWYNKIDQNEEYRDDATTKEYFG